MKTTNSSGLLPPGMVEGVDESTWIDVIQKMDEVYSRLIDEEVELEKKNNELEQTQQFILSVLGAMSDVLIVCDEKGLIEQANKALCDLVGKTESQLRASRWIDLLADEQSAATVLHVLSHQDEIHKGHGIELNLMDHQGQAIPVDASCTPRLGGNGKRLGTVWVGRPTAELKRAYRDMRAAHEALKKTQQQLLHSEKMASLGQLVAGVAHELNNPISFVLGNVHALNRYCDRLQTYMSALGQEKISENLQAMEQQLRIAHMMKDLPSLIEGTLEGAQRTADIVRGLKRFSAVDSGERTEVNLGEVIDRSIHWLKKGRSSSVQIHWDCPNHCRVFANAGQLQQVMMNLIQNAFDALCATQSPGIWIDLEVEKIASDSVVQVTIRDNGPGVATEHLLRVFDPFFTTKPVGQGTGLGLSISYGIIEQHGGKLSVRNAESGGAIFRVELPIFPSSFRDKTGSEKEAGALRQLH